MKLLFFVFGVLISTASMAASQAINSPANWHTEKSVSNFDDSVSVYTATSSLGRTDCGSGRALRKANLVIRCEKGITQMFFMTQCLHPKTLRKITFRTKPDKAFKKFAWPSTNRKAMGYWDNENSLPMVKRLLGKDNLFVLIPNSNEERFELEFNIAGFDRAIQPIRDLCHW